MAAVNGFLVFRGQSGRSYNISTYISDVLAASCTFNLNGVAVAGSQNFYLLPENCTLTDFTVASGAATTTTLVVQINDANTGNVIGLAANLSSLNTRQNPNIPFGKGMKLTLIQA